MVKCLIHGLRGFNGAVQRRLTTLTVTMLISSCWQLSSKVELRRIFDVCKRWANSGSHKFVKKNMIRYKNLFTSCIEIYYCHLLIDRIGSWIFCITYLVPSITYIVSIKLSFTVFQKIIFLDFSKFVHNFCKKVSLSWYLG